MREVLESPDIGRFDEVTFIANPDPLQMQQSIEELFSGRKKDDLLFLFFSGHGIKDSSGKLYLASSQTKKNARGEIIKSTAVSASFVHDILKDSRCKRKVVVLDCCFSGAFAQGLAAKDDGSVDIKSQLGSEGCAILTSSSSIQYSFEQQDEDLSVYTRYLVEGIQTGAADLGSDGFISVDELHEYAQRKVYEESPSMNPKIYALEEGYKIYISEAVTADPLVQYQRAVEQCAQAGEISPVWRITLDELRLSLFLSEEQSAQIEARVLKPFREYKKKLKRYQAAFEAAILQGTPLKRSTRLALNHLQKTLALTKQDVQAIESAVEQGASKQSTQPTSASQAPKTTLTTIASNNDKEVAPSATSLSNSSSSIPPTTTAPSNPQPQPTLDHADQPLQSELNPFLPSQPGSGQAQDTFHATLPPGGFAPTARPTQPRATHHTQAHYPHSTADTSSPTPVSPVPTKPETTQKRKGNSTLKFLAGLSIAGLTLGSAVTGWQLMIPNPSPPVRPIEDIVHGVVEKITEEECRYIDSEYRAENSFLIDALTLDPTFTAVGQHCINLGYFVPPIEFDPPIEPSPPLPDPIYPPPNPLPTPEPQPPLPEPVPSPDPYYIIENLTVRRTTTCYATIKGISGETAANFELCDRDDLLNIPVEIIYGPVTVQHLSCDHLSDGEPVSDASSSSGAVDPAHEEGVVPCDVYEEIVQEGVVDARPIDLQS